ncbi:MAG: hypothetical protein HC805_06425 [Alkalinema sp. RL_2_19]|nr:hypothetical protein [Alkalinema sp. RL_2_19]
MHLPLRRLKPTGKTKPQVPQTRSAGKWATGLLALLCLTAGWPASVQAEGSRSLYPASATGYRANIEWRDNKYGSLVLRRTLLKVYAQKDEYILVGSTAVGVDQGDIRIFDPGQVTGAVGAEIIPSVANFTCTIAQPGQGKITSRIEELAGPKSITGNNNPTGYTPCYYRAPTTGIYDVVMTGPDGFGSTRDGSIATDIALTNSNNFDVNQRSSVAAWDVTVRSSLTSITDRNGRLFAYYYALFTGNNGRPLYFSTYPITTDGFRYKVDFRGADPNGFLLYGEPSWFLR